MNPIMIDGTGMCGVCRLTVAGSRKFACVDGPEFDAPRDRLGRGPGATRELRGRRGGSAAPQRSHVPLLSGGRGEIDVTATVDSTTVSGRQPMPKQDPAERVRNFDEVALGYSAEEAGREAARCLACKKPKCVDGCPVGIDVPAFIEAIVGRRPRRRASRGSSRPTLCPPCAAGCARRRNSASARASSARRASPSRSAVSSVSWPTGRPSWGQAEAPRVAPANGRRVAVVGSGPAGLTVAADLADARLRRHGLRGAPRSRRRTHLRDPGVPPPQGHRRAARWTTCEAWASTCASTT